MPLYYVTGTPGAGKSSVRTELQHRGFTAYETDDLAGFYDKRTGQKTDSGKTAASRTKAWRKYHEWKIPLQEIENLRTEAEHKVVFLCGVVANDLEFWDKFDRVFCLYVAPDQLAPRLHSRSDDEAFGKNPHELADALAWAAYAEQQYRGLGATIIDASLPLRQVTDQIVNAIKGH